MEKKEYICYVEINIDDTGFLKSGADEELRTTRLLSLAHRFSEDEAIKESERLDKCGFTNNHWFEW